MKFLRKTFDNLYEKLPHKWHPIVDTLDTFVFTPNRTTNKGSHIRDAIDLKRTIFMVIIALTPCLLFGMFNVGHQHYTALGQFMEPMEGFWDKFFYGAVRVLPMIIVTYAAGLGVEFIFAIRNNHGGLHEGFLVSGMLIPLSCPIETPLWMIAIATAFAVVFGKEVFGGTGMNIMNVALLARAFLFFGYPTMMSGDKVWVSGIDGKSAATALGDLASFTGDKPKFASILDFTNNYSLWDSFTGLIPGSVGETSVIACLLGAALLLFTGVASIRVMGSMFIGGLTMALLFNAVALNPFMELDAFHQLWLGGFMFGLVFMATDPVTASQTNKGKIIYGFFCGFFAIMIRVFNPAYPEGVMLAILFMNIMAPMIDHYVIQSNVKKRVKRLKLKNA